MVDSLVPALIHSLVPQLVDSLLPPRVERLLPPLEESVKAQFVRSVGRSQLRVETVEARIRRLYDMSGKAINVQYVIMEVIIQGQGI